MNKIWRTLMEEHQKLIPEDINTDIYAFEEMGELAQQIGKMNRGKGNKAKLTDEVSDVAINLLYLIYKYDLNEEEVRGTIDRKLHRMVERAEKGEF